MTPGKLIQQQTPFNYDHHPLFVVFSSECGIVGSCGLAESRRNICLSEYLHKNLSISHTTHSYNMLACRVSFPTKNLCSSSTKNVSVRLTKGSAVVARANVALQLSGGK